MRLTAREVASAAQGHVIEGEPEAAATSFTIDSRTLVPGACFVAIQGARDGHDFVPDAFGRGASIAVVARPVEPLQDGGRAVVRVADPLGALGDLGSLARERLRSATVVAITGSAGKTATKDLLASAAGRVKRVASSPSSFNNEAGVPLTLLGADPDTEVVVAEMGARFAGNIADLCAIARPEVGLLTQVGLAHAGPLGGRSGIAAVKGELLEALPASGLAVLNADDEPTPALARRTRARVLRVGRAADADARVTDVVVDDELRPSFRLETDHGTLRARLELRGEHHVSNAAMAAVVALELGVPGPEVEAGLAETATERWRMQLVSTPDGITVLNDAYNASPTSTSAALRALARLPASGRRIAVLGEMRELGAEATAAHAEIGRQAVVGGIDIVVAVGEGAAGIARGAGEAGTADIVEVGDPDAAREVVVSLVRPGDVVLVKASRAVGLELVADALVGAGAAS